MASDAQQGAGVVESGNGWQLSRELSASSCGQAQRLRGVVASVDPQLLSAASRQLEAQDLARRQAAATAGHMGERQRMR